ncbi:MAG TPA: metal-sensing transcriptional repressor [Oscillospiraceae bacterium]|nr:metal-sensing transcriptional repressor [Oscillospiraceae bacterium]HPF55270.1 metal-sensing transcriptional repressor [Clostridiales bacterium]HPK36005.1 metal-sensing transcriptional repressor [Oscillospiraceae bacterium]
MNECCHKTKHRESEEFNALQNRLKRIEGQVRGLQKMLSEDAYCTDILTQVSAVQSALNAFSKVLLENHIRTCVVTDIKNGDDAVVTDLVETIQKLMK